MGNIWPVLKWRNEPACVKAMRDDPAVWEMFVLGESCERLVCLFESWERWSCLYDRCQRWSCLCDSWKKWSAWDSFKRYPVCVITVRGDHDCKICEIFSLSESCKRWPCPCERWSHLVWAMKDNLTTVLVYVSVHVFGWVHFRPYGGSFLKDHWMHNGVDVWRPTGVHEKRVHCVRYQLQQPCGLCVVLWLFSPSPGRVAHTSCSGLPSKHGLTYLVWLTLWAFENVNDVFMIATFLTPMENVSVYLSVLGWLSNVARTLILLFSSSFFFDTINVISVKLCMVVLLTELYPFIPLSLTLNIFQGYSSDKQF